MLQLAEKGWLRSFIVFYFLFLFRQLSRVFLWPWFLFSISMNPLQIPTERMQDLQINIRISSIWIWGNMSKWVCPKIGGNPPKWTVYFMETTLLKWMIWGVFPLFLVQHPNSGTPKSSILMGFSLMNHPFGGFPIFLETPKCLFGNVFFGRKYFCKSSSSSGLTRWGKVTWNHGDLKRLYTRRV